jgi:aspartyl-tRNA(Asn)/glutamyl-tRNA(Gln) amidotransferase subunit A
VEAALDAAEASQPTLNAFTALDRDGALAAAARAGRQLAEGDAGGPLLGIPVAVKDLVDTAGVATTMGSAQFAGRVPDRDAACIARLRGAGAIVIGKTTTHEVAFGPTGDVAAGGPCRNPRDPTRMAGGSSAGSAAAVAAGIVPLAVGTDTGGSVRIPAALCGTVGFRPSPGRIPTDGVLELAWSLDAVGPLAGNVADAVLGFRAMADTPEVGIADARELRIGVVVAPWFERVDPAVGAAVSDAIDALARAGVRILEVPVADAEELAETYRLVQSGEAVAIHHERLTRTPERFAPETLERLRVAAEVPAWAYARALRRLVELRAEALERFVDADVLLTPTVPILAPEVGARDAQPGGWESPRQALLAFASPWSVLGLPAVSVPAPRSPGDLPVGLQLIGSPGGDEALLAAAGHPALAGAG